MIRFLLEFFLVILIFLKYPSRIRIANIHYILLLGFTSIVLHTFSTFKIEDLFESARLLSILTFTHLILHLKNDDIKRIFKYLFLIHMFAIIWNFYDGGYFLEWMKFNNLNLKSAYGRNSGIFNSLAIAGFFCVSTIIYCMADKPDSTRYTLLVIAIIMLLLTGSKSNYLAGILVLSIGVFIKMKSSIKKFKITKSILIIIPLLGCGFFYFNKSSLDFQSLQQIPRLLNALSSGNAGSVDARFEIWGSYFEIQFQSLAYTLIGTPKTILNVHNSTFDSDYVWLITRFGLIGFLMILFSLTILLVKIFSYQQYQLSFYIFTTLFVATMIGVLSDPQGLLIAVLFYRLLANTYDNKKG